MPGQLERIALPHPVRSSSAPTLIRCVFGMLVVMLLFASAAQATLRLAVTAAPDPVLPGELMQVTVTIAQESASPSGALTLQMLYPNHLFDLDDSLITDGGDCFGSYCDSGETITWNLGNLPPGGGMTVSLPPVVVSGASAPADGTVISFAADLFEGGNLRVQTSDSVTVNAGRVFDLAVDENRDPVPAGQQLIYALTYGNRSASAASNSELRFPIPSGTTYVAASSGGSLVGGEVRWNLGTLPAGEGGRHQVTVQVGAGQPQGRIFKTASSKITGTSNFLPTESRARVATRVENGVPLDLAMNVGADPAQRNEPLRAELTVTNQSPATPLFGVTLRLRFPKLMNDLDDTLDSDAGACPGSYCDSSEMLVWSPGTLQPGEGLTVSLPPSVANSALRGTVLSFIAEVFDDGGDHVVASQSFLMRWVRIFDLSVDEDRDPVMAGSQLRYVLTYGNLSASSTTGTQLRFPLPPGSTFTSASDGGSHSGGVVTWNLGTLIGREVGRREVTVKVGSGLAEGALLDVDPVTITGNDGFVNQQTRARTATRVLDDSPLDLAIAIQGDPLEPNETSRVELVVSNRSAIDFLTGVTLRLRYPNQFFDLDDSLDTDSGDCPGSYCDSTEFLTWTLGTLPPGGGVNVALPPTLANPSGGSVLPLVVKATADGGLSAVASHAAAVRAQRVFDLTVTESLEPVAPGQTLTYALTYGNRSSTATTGTELRFPLPPGTTLLATSGGSTVNSNQVVWNLGTLGGHEGGRREVVVQVGAGVARGTILEVNAATISGNANFVRHQTRAQSLVRVMSTPPLGLSLSFDTSPALPGQTVKTSLTVTNLSGGTAFNTVLQLRFPQHFFDLDDSLILDGGDCPGSYCDSTEILTWNLGNLGAGSSKMVMLQPVMNSSTAPPQGETIDFWAQAYSDAFGKTIINKALLVGDAIDITPLVPVAFFSDGFESGNLSAWSTARP